MIWKLFSRKRADSQAPTHQRDLTGGQLIHFNRYSSDSGEPISPDTVMRIPTVNACVRLICEDLAGLPFPVYKRGSKGRERIDDNYVSWVLNNPNDDMTAFSFFEAMNANLLLHGNAYAYIKKDSIGRPSNLYPINPYYVTLGRKNGELSYGIKINGKDEPFSPANILHITGYSSDGIRGKSVIEQAANVCGIALSIDSFGAKFFANGMALSGFIRPTGKLSKEAEATLERTIKENWTGKDNAFRIGVMPPNTEWQSVTLSPEEGQFNQTKETLVKELCRLFRVNPIKIGEKGNYNSMEQVAIDHATGCLRPFAQRWEAECCRKLFLEKDKPNFYCEMELDGMLRGDSASQDNSFAKGVQNGWYCVNDIRRLKNLPAIEGGDVYLSPLNMTPTTQRPENQPQQKETQVNAFAPVLEDLSRRLATKIGNAVSRQAGKSKKLGQWLDEYLNEKAEVFRASATPVLTTSHRSPAASALIVDTFLENMRAKLVEDVENAQTFDALPQFTEQLEGTILTLLEGAV